MRSPGVPDRGTMDSLRVKPTEPPAGVVYLFPLGLEVHVAAARRRPQSGKMTKITLASNGKSIPGLH